MGQPKVSAAGLVNAVAVQSESDENGGAQSSPPNRVNFWR